MKIKSIIWTSMPNRDGEVYVKPGPQGFVGKPFSQDGHKLGEIVDAYYVSNEEQIEVIVKIDEPYVDKIREFMDENMIVGTTILEGNDAHNNDRKKKL